MRIVSFWAKGYRSLRDVRIENLGSFNVFYGRNGSGKSNILEAMRTLFALAPFALGNVIQPGSSFPPGDAIKRRDLCSQDPSRKVVLGARLVSTTEAPEFSAGTTSMRELTLEVTLDWLIDQQPRLAMTCLRSEMDDLLERLAPKSGVPKPKGVQFPLEREIQAIVSQTLPHRAFAVVSADRATRPETIISHQGREDVIAEHLRNGRIKNAFLAAQNHPSHAIRRRFSELRKLLSGPPLSRPEVAPVHDPHTSEVDLREVLPEPNPEGKDVSLDLAGLGVAQIYSILAQCMLLGADAIGIEEPEAHLHAPTSGKDLRQLLKRLVDEEHIDQLFIATHSNLFDLDPKGYFDVSLKDGCTVVERAELTRVDREHLYEPGPAKHALLRMLEYMPPDDVVFRRPDGSPIGIDEMMRLLQEDDDLAVEFLKDLHSAALRMLKTKAKRAPGS